MHKDHTRTVQDSPKKQLRNTQARYMKSSTSYCLVEKRTMVGEPVEPRRENDPYYNQSLGPEVSNCEMIVSVRYLQLSVRKEHRSRNAPHPSESRQDSPGTGGCGMGCALFSLVPVRETSRRDGDQRWSERAIEQRVVGKATLRGVQAPWSLGASKD